MYVVVIGWHEKAELIERLYVHHYYYTFMYFVDRIPILNICTVCASNFRGVNLASWLKRNMPDKR